MKIWRIVIIYIFILLLSPNYKLGLLLAQKEPPKQEEAAKGEDELKKEKEAAGAAGNKEETKEGKGEEKKEVKKTLTEPARVLEIKRLEAEEPAYSIELRNVELVDLFRVIAHDYNFNILVDKDVSGKITASFTNISLEEAMAGIAEMSNLVLQKKGNMIKLSPNLITKIFTLKYLEAKKILESSTAATGTTGTTSATGTTATAGQSGGTVSTEESTAKQANTIYDLISDRGKILLGKQPNSLIVIDYPSNIEKVEDYLKAIDLRMASRVFKLKFLKANEVVGATTTTSGTSTATAATTGTTSSGVSSTGSSSTGMSSGSGG